MWSLALAVWMLLSISCSDNIEPAGTLSNGKVSVTLTLAVGNTTPLSSRSMTVDEEKKIDNLSILVFRKEAGTDDSTGTLYYQAAVTPVEGTSSYTVGLYATTKDEEYSVMVIANAGNAIGYNYIGQTKQAIVAQLTTNCTTAWPARQNSSTAFKPIPMWGETAYGKITTNSLPGGNTIQLLRSLARFDVGLNYASTDGSEGFKGITGYTLKKVILFRTRSASLIVPASVVTGSAGHLSVNTPSLPASATIINAGAVGSSGGGFSYDVSGGESVREIYLPENDATTPTVAVVGIEDAGGKLGYYRLENVDTSGKARPILRNHRYIFNVTGVTGSGQDTPEDALNAVYANINYTVVEYEINESNLWMSGKYYLKVSQREVDLSPLINEGISFTYETNLPTHEVKWAWKDAETEDPFTRQHITFADEGRTTNAAGITTGTITLSAPANNTKSDRTNELQFTGGAVTGVVTVYQPRIPMEFSILKGSIKVNGNYMVGATPDPSTNYIELTLNHIAPNALGAEWIVQTDTQNGLHFSGSGIFTSSPTQTIRIYADTTTPMTPGGLAILTISTNSTLTTPADAQSVLTPTVEIVIGFSTKHILSTAGWNSDGIFYGAATDSEFSSWWLLFGGTGRTGSNNVGNTATDDPLQNTNPNFSLKGRMPVYNMTLWYTEDVEYGITTNSTLYKKITATPPPDIIFIGWSNYVEVNTSSSTSVYNALMDYVNRGGVLIYCMEEANTSSAAKALANLFDGTITIQAPGSTVVDGNTNTMVPLSAHPDDPILSGTIGGQHYFDAVGGLKWVHNNSTYLSAAITPGHENDVVAYSYLADDGSHISMLRSTKKNILWCADGGLLYQVRVSSGTYEPRTYRNGNNGAIFRNIMGWAIYQAEFHGINSGGLNPGGADRNE
jgi:hypothetical protein